MPQISLGLTQFLQYVVERDRSQRSRTKNPCSCVEALDLSAVFWRSFLHKPTYSILTSQVRLPWLVGVNVDLEDHGSSYSYKGFYCKYFCRYAYKKYITSTKARDLPCVFSLGETHEGMASIQSKKEAFKSNKVPKNGKCLTWVWNTLTLGSAQGQCINLMHRFFLFSSPSDYTHHI